MKKGVVYFKKNFFYSNKRYRISICEKFLPVAPESGQYKCSNGFTCVTNFILVMHGNPCVQNKNHSNN